MFVLLIILILLGDMFVLFSGIIDINRLLPVLENGWKPVFKSAFQQILVFPFGETVCFAMLLPYLNKPQQTVKVGWTAMVVSGIILSFTIALNVAVLGVDITSRSTFPLLTTISKINIANFLQRLDAIVILSLIITDFFKIAIYYYVAVIGITDLFKVQRHSKLVFPIAIIILFSSMTIASSFVEHINEGLVTTLLIRTIPLEVGIPLLLLAVALIRKRYRH